jgi:tape measure domain-containing protein
MSLQTQIELRDNFSAILNGIVSSISLAVDSMYDMQAAMNADVNMSSVEAAKEQIDQATAAVQRMNQELASLGTTPARAPVVSWNTQSNMQVFDSNGIQRMNQEMSALNSVAEEVFHSQRTIDEQALRMNVLPPEASWDINNTSQRISELQNRLNNLQNQDVSLLNDDSAAMVNQQYESIRSSMNQIVNLQSQMNQAIDEGNVSQLNESYNQLNRTIEQVEQQARATGETIRSLTNIRWNTQSDLQVFDGNGAERFRNEVQSANAMLQQMNNTQRAVWQTAENMDLLPDGAVADIGSVGARIGQLQMRIQQISSNRMNLGTDRANAGLEQLRTQLNQAVQEQNSLNEALGHMDVEAANQAYLRLSQTIGNTERYIRDNVDGQGRFNEQIQQGTQSASGLVDMVKRAVTAYLGIQSIGKVINLSDSLTQTVSRIDLMNDGLQTTEELSNMIYASAQNSRGEYAKTAAFVARLGNNAGEAFGSSEEVVSFANLVQKQMTIAGATTGEASAAMLQLSQALGSGVLRGDELNSIFENAPNLIRNIADYLGVSIGEIRGMAKEGEITADIVKNAIFAASDEINERFDTMPMTWQQVWQSMQNTALMASKPVLQRINDMANSEELQSFANGAVEMLATLANMALNVFDLMAQGAAFVSDNWSLIGPVILGVAAALGIYYTAQALANIVGKAGRGIHFVVAVAQMMHAAATRSLTRATAADIAAQNGLNAALYACPLVWILVMIIAVVAAIYLVVAAINKVAHTTISAGGVIVGAATTVCAFLYNAVAGVVNFVIGIGVELLNLILTFANSILIAFQNPVKGILTMFSGMLDFIIGIVQSAAELIDTVLGSDLAGAVEGFRNDFQDKVSDIVGDDTEVEIKKVNAADYQLERIGYQDAYEYGYVGADLDEAVSDFSLSDLFGKTEVPNPDDYAYLYNGDLSGMSSPLDSIADSTDSIDDKMDITEEDLKYLRDLAEQETINRFTTAEINIDQSGMKNIVQGTDDLDGFVEGLTEAVNNAVQVMAEGVHY